MRVLLRKRKNGFYYQGAGTWVNNPDKGHDFGSLSDALELGDFLSAQEHELALAFEHSGTISVLPLDRRTELRPRQMLP
jgi:hypothetical protein